MAAPVDDLLLTPAGVAAATARMDDEHVVLDLTAGVAQPPAPELYPVLTETPQTPALQASKHVPVTLSPYFLWGNRQPLAMRVWLRTEREY